MMGEQQEHLGLPSPHQLTHPTCRQLCPADMTQPQNTSWPLINEIIGNTGASPSAHSMGNYMPAESCSSSLQQAIQHLLVPEWMKEKGGAIQGSEALWQRLTSILSSERKKRRRMKEWMNVRRLNDLLALQVKAPQISPANSAQCQGKTKGQVRRRLQKRLKHSTKH